MDNPWPKVCNKRESVIYEAFHVKITNIAEAQFPHLLHKTYTHIAYNVFMKKFYVKVFL